MTGKFASLIASATLSLGLAANGFASTPTPLTDVEMDTITAGQTGAPPLVLTDSVAPMADAAIVASPQLAGNFLGGLVTVAPFFFLLSPASAQQATGSVNSNSSQNGMSSSMSSSGSRS